MTHHHPRRRPLAVCALALAACADHNAKPTTTKTVTATSVTSAPTSGTTKTRSATTSVTSVPGSRTQSGAAATAASGPLPNSTGIAACDEYLASYKSCHLAAGVFARDQIEPRYEMMRTSLLRQSQDPDMRDQLQNRCVSLASQLKDALHGKSCADTPAPASTR
jgi:glucose/arabinose dehydrogenase